VESCYGYTAKHEAKMSTAFDWERTIFIYGRAGVDEDDSTTQHVSVKEVTEQMAGFASRPDDVTLMLHSLGGTYDGVMEILSFEHLVPFRTNVFSFGCCLGEAPGHEECRILVPQAFTLCSWA